jgi:Flp pilus assembly protein TadG
MSASHPLRSEAGQVLPLTAIFMAALLLFAALAIDVTSVLSSERFYTTTAEASALAGAQDLQTGKTRQVNASDRIAARANAMAVLVNRLGASSTPTAGNCSTSSDIMGCALPGTDYLVSIQTPSPSCAMCDSERAVQVSVRNPSYPLTFAALAGQSSWDVGATAVAGLVFSGKYAIQTLRPPDPLPNGLDQNRQNISLDGTNTDITVIRGDIGTNTSAFTNADNYIDLGSGYRIDHIDDIDPDPWNKLNGLPEGRLITNLIPDPAYARASFDGAPTFADQESGEVVCPTPSTSSDPTDFPPDYLTILQNAAYDVTCYQPGVYADKQGFNVSRNTDVAYLLPGAYRFEGKGLDVGGTLMGGLIGGQPGVHLEIPQSAEFAGNNAVAIILNAGDQTCQADSCRALPALDHSDVPVETPEGLIVTITVPRDEQCFNGTTPLNVKACTTSNSTISLPGNGQLDLSGVIYAPSDNIQVNGDGTSQTGRVGQLIAWTIKYGGGAQLVQDYPQLEEIGILRLDPACTAPSEPCNSS